MPTLYYLGASPLEIPGDGTREVQVIEVGGTVDVDVNPLPVLFSEDAADVRNWDEEDVAPEAVTQSEPSPPDTGEEVTS